MNFEAPTLAQSVERSETKKFEYTSENWPYREMSFEEWKENGSLLAKEGVPSKLNTEQYNLVRSQEFKDWFGDWEQSDRKDVSVFVDKDTGEPQVFYRGDKSRFKEGFLIKPEEERMLNTNKEYSLSEATPIAGARSQGLFFTNSKKVALNYGMDIDAVTLGKYKIDPQQDHPETFPKLVAFLKSVAQTDRNFWQKIIKHHCGGVGVSAQSFKRNFERAFRNILDEDLRQRLWDSIESGRGSFGSEGMIDHFVKNGQLEWLVEGVMGNNYVNPREQFSSKAHGSYAPWSKHAPESARQLSRLLAEYRSEPLALSSVFLRSINPKEGAIVGDGFEVYRARMDGYDTYIHRNGVGNGTADEVVIFDLKNIRTFSKESLQDVAYKEKTRYYA